jgi:hypothetical protein
MKKKAAIFGYSFLAITAVLIIAFGFLFLQKQKLDRESGAFADRVIIAIVARWDLAELRKRASLEFENDADYNEIRKCLNSLRTLGKVVSYEGATGEASITLSLRHGYRITAKYTATVKFEAGYGEIDISLIKLEGIWQILDFEVGPAEFMQDKDSVL